MLRCFWESCVWDLDLFDADPEFRINFLNSDPHPMLLETNCLHLFILFQESFFDLLFEKQAFIFGVTTVEEAMSNFFICFTF